jgi:lipoate-protein ligase A
MPATKQRLFRFVYSGNGDSSTNMAMDEAVMTGLREGTSTPILRIYKWDPPTISIGYFQKISDIDLDKCHNSGIGVVRRLTGGRAVLHHEELTYSILLTEKDFVPFKKKDLFLFIAQCLVDSLRILGVHSKIAEKSRGSLHSANCFASPAQFEVESLKEGKLIGSAQVIKDGIMLQHGAIPLTGSYSKISKYLTVDAKSFKSVSSLGEVSKTNVSEEKLLSALKIGFGKHIDLVDGELSVWEMQKTVELAKIKYGTKEWLWRK